MARGSGLPSGLASPFSAGGSKLAAPAYTAATAAEAEAASLYKRGRLAEAMAKF